MGTTTYGSFTAKFSRRLSDREFEEWEAAVKGHEPVVDTRWSWEAYDPAGWTFDDDEWGDIGHFRLHRLGFEVETEGKVYDVTDAIETAVRYLPSDVMVAGEGIFDTEGEHWGVRVKDREVRERSAEVVLAPWDPEVDA